MSFDDEEEKDQDETSPNTPVESRSRTPVDRTSTSTPTTDGEDGILTTRKRLAANTNVGFQAKSMSKAALLRDAQTKEMLRKEFLAMQERVKATDFLLPFVFYAGKDIPGGVCRMRKGDLVWLFLDRARKVGAEVSSSDRSRREWARVSVDDLMLVRGDIIIPHVGHLSLLQQASANSASITSFTISCSTKRQGTVALFSHILQSRRLRAH